MDDPTIKCPNCKTEIKLTESLAAPLIEATRAQFEQKLQEKDLLIRAKEASVAAEKQQLEHDREQLDSIVAQRLDEARKQIAAEESRKAREVANDALTQKDRELLELRGVIEQKETKLAEAQKTQLDLLRKQRELDDAK